ncbi:transcriptional regulator [Bacillota bacterium Meth-B3]|nr:helix-turn-helix transcriptional regulator [Christensenellaceae bacterium]MEA5067031.1 helix-turn-helix transcriptional regulator [Eubacteriales bacterium]MEA5069664.1 helix-turn-helix transcriptional regulator [Christensenellaceae bacterium]
MKSIHDESAFFAQLLDMLESQLSSHNEILLHDLTNGYEHTIVDIRNGHITNRKIGDCGSNLGLEVLRGTVENGDRYNYVTHTRDGKILRSSTMFIKGDDGRVIGALCINKDITASVEMEKYLHEQNNYPLLYEQGENDGHVIKEVFLNNVGELLDYLLQEALRFVGKQAALMDREDKCRFLKYLDDKGAFVISKSGDRVCEFLGISKYTLYNYLDAVRNQNGGGKPSGDAQSIS